MSHHSSVKSVAVVDLARYSDIGRYLEQNLGAGAVAELNKQIQHAIQFALQRALFDCEEIPRKYTGDGAILIFNNPIEALDFASHLFQYAENHNSKRNVPLAQRHFRVGIATGPVVLEPRRMSNGEIVDYEFHGTTISDAVRLEAACLTGSVLIDAETFQSLPTEKRDGFCSEIEVHGKRTEVFLGHLKRLIDAAPWDVCKPTSSEIPASDQPVDHVDEHNQPATEPSAVASQAQSKNDRSLWAKELVQFVDEIHWSDSMHKAVIESIETMIMTHSSVYSATHLLIGMLAYPAGKLATVIQERGIDPVALKKQLTDVLTGDLKERQMLQVGASLSRIFSQLQRDHSTGEVTEEQTLECLIQDENNSAAILLKALKFNPVLQPRAKQLSGAMDFEQLLKSELVSQFSKIIRDPIFHRSGKLRSEVFDTATLLALRTAARITEQTQWQEIRSPHLFLGILCRPNSILAERVLHTEITTPEVLKEILVSFLQQPGETQRTFSIEKASFSDNALSVFRSAAELAAQTDSNRILEDHILQTILDGDSHVISQIIAQLGISKDALLP